MLEMGSLDSRVEMEEHSPSDLIWGMKPVSAPARQHGEQVVVKEGGGDEGGGVGEEE